MSPLSRHEFLQRTAHGWRCAAALLHLSFRWASSAAPDRVGVIGCGSVSGQYLPHLSKSPHVELVSTCDIVYERAQKRAASSASPHHYPHIDQMLAGEPFDLLVNLTDMQEHGRLNKQALLAGRHVWSEKPMANTYQRRAGAARSGQRAQAPPLGRAGGGQQPAVRLHGHGDPRGKLGKSSRAHAHYGHLGPTWSAFFYEKGGGSLPDLGVYNLATLTGLLGPARAVMAMTAIVTPERTVDNKGTITVEAEDNAMVLMDHGRRRPVARAMRLQLFRSLRPRGKGQDRATPSPSGAPRGNMGLVGYDWAPFGVDLATTNHEQPQRFATDTGDYVWQQGATVVARGAGHRRASRDRVEHALHVLEVIEAARESGRTGKRIALTVQLQVADGVSRCNAN